MQSVHLEMISKQPPPSKDKKAKKQEGGMLGALGGMGAGALGGMGGVRNNDGQIHGGQHV